jgi:Tfp pilus assembly protein PilN
VTRRPYNLASRPFRNETLPALLLAAGWVLLLAGSLVHALAVRRLLPASTSARHQEVADLERRLARLDTRAESFRLDVPEATLLDWSFVKDLVDRRAFSWTRLLYDLGRALPPGVRVMSVAPDAEDDRLIVELSAFLRAPQDGLDMVRRLEDSDEFSDVTPLSTSEMGDGREMRLRMRYAPARTSPSPAAHEAARARRRKERP